MNKVYEALNRYESKIAASEIPLPGFKIEAGVTPERKGSAQPLSAGDMSIHVGRQLPVRLSPRSPLLPFDGTSSEAAEQYRILRTKLIQHPGSPKVIVVSSAGSGDGKSVNAINLAGSLALIADSKVLLIDADLRRSSIHSNLGIPLGPGLNQVLEKAVALSDAIVQLEGYRNLFVLTAGDRRSNSTELLESPEWPAALATLRQSFRFIIVDSVPVGALADYEIVQTTSDGVIVVVRPDHTDRALCLKALKAVQKNKLIGVLMNCVPDFFPTVLGRRNAGYEYYSPAGPDSQRQRSL